MRQQVLRRLAGLLIVVAGCANAPQPASNSAAPVVVFAASSTKDVLEFLAQDFEKQAGTAVQIVPGPSSGLAKQIYQAGKADLFLSADEPTADFLAEKGLVAERRNLLTNRLVVIVPADAGPDIKTLQDLTDDRIKRIAVAEPKVPAGEYARDALLKSGMLDRLKEKFVGGIDVKATLQFVARGEADAGFVYLTDTIGNSKVRVALKVESNLHRPIVYPLVLLESAAEKQSARRFYEFLGTPHAAERFQQAQFGLAP